MISFVLWVKFMCVCHFFFFVDYISFFLFCRWECKQTLKQTNVFSHLKTKALLQHSCIMPITIQYGKQNSYFHSMSNTFNKSPDVYLSFMTKLPGKPARSSLDAARFKSAKNIWRLCDLALWALAVWKTKHLFQSFTALKLYLKDYVNKMCI